MGVVGRLWWLSGVGLLAGCSLLTDLGALGDGGATVDAVADGNDSAAPTCNGTAGPQAVPAGTFCIDSTEVTNGQYAAFLASSPDPASQIAPCTWNTSFAPLQAPDAGADDYPVEYVNWCDAYAFCTWAGKRLCGRIGGGPITADNALVDPAQDEWFSACSHVGERLYPYGITYDPSACNGPERDAGAWSETADACAGGYPGVRNMVGNVDEWENACVVVDASAPAADNCVRRSGSFENPDGDVQTCSYYRFGARGATDHDIGFRCCSDLVP
jgi:sulfatase modifying factor 1